MLPQFCACVHPLHGSSEMLTQQQHDHIYKWLSSILAEEVWAPPHHLVLEVTQGVCRGEEVGGGGGAEAGAGAARWGCGLHHVQLEPHEVFYGTDDRLLLQFEHKQVWILAYTTATASDEDAWHAPGFTNQQRLQYHLRAW